MNTKNKILVVCHDAGGAEILSAYINARKNSHAFKCVVSGPAVNIFKRKKIRNLVVVADNEDVGGIFEKNMDVGLVITGTGWGSKLEVNFIRHAKRRGIKTASFLDHWVNYRERFGYPRVGWSENLPDEIWVGDKYALAMAKKLFSGLTIKMTPNPFFREIKSAYKKVKKRGALIGSAVLFASEPLNSPSSRFHNKKMISFDEQKILVSFLDCLLKIGWRNPVIIRRHPAEDRNKYKEIISKYSARLAVRMSVNESPYGDLSAARLVVGMKSMFLETAVLCGKTAVSFLPRNKSVCPLPDKRILRIKNLSKLEKILSQFNY